MKVLTFVKLTEKGQLVPPDQVPATLAKVQEIVAAYGGKMDEIWATGGRYDFVVMAEYPDNLAAFKSRTKITELGLFHLEAVPAFPIETYIEAATESKVLIAV